MKNYDNCLYELFNTPYEEGETSYTPLIAACIAGHCSIVQYLLTSNLPIDVEVEGVIRHDDNNLIQGTTGKLITKVAFFLFIKFINEKEIIPCESPYQGKIIRGVRVSAIKQLLELLLVAESGLFSGPLRTCCRRRKTTLQPRKAN